MSCEGYDRCTAVLVSKTLVMSLYAPTLDCDVAFYEMMVFQVLSVLQRGKRHECQAVLPRC